MENFQLALDWGNRPIVSVALGILVGILILLVGRWLAKVIARYATRSMERAQVDDMVIRFAQTLIYFGLMVAVVIAALNAVGIHTTSLTALLASAGVAIGLAVKDSLANFAAGVMILMFKPYRTGDFVEVAGTSGSVEEVSIFNTILHTTDNVQVIVPNSAVIGDNIKNYSANDLRRVDLVAGIGYEENIGAARDLLMEIMTAHPLVLADPAPSVDVLELAASTVDLAVRPWARTDDYAQVRSEMLEQMKVRFDEAGISMPYPQQDVHVHQAA
ncbi:MAG: mechanosensitive ion channel [Anaerolineae bacterium]|jgi:small conductance mechanosensitive channel